MPFRFELTIQYIFKKWHMDIDKYLKNMNKIIEGTFFIKERNT
jgi:hypothetical protein